MAGSTAGGRARPPLVLCYHKVEPRWELGVTRISPRRFTAQIERFARAGWRTLALEEVVACARGERTIGAREFAITFDDAYRGLRDHAFPVLRAHGYGAACFVVTDYAGAFNRWDVAYGGRRFAHLAWRDMRRWQCFGIEFGSHTATHARLTWLDDCAVADELSRSRDALERALDVPARTVSYPFGAAGERELQLARACGYAAGFRLLSRDAPSVMAIPRHPVYVWSPPTPALGPLAPLERVGAIGANKCAVGTSLLQQRRPFGRRREAGSRA